MSSKDTRDELVSKNGKQPFSSLPNFRLPRSQSLSLGEGGDESGDGTRANGVLGSAAAGRPESKGGRPNVGQTLRRFVACNDGSVTDRIIRRGWGARIAQADYRTSRTSKSPPLHELPRPAV
jgi:hypothetical protein